MGKNKNQLMIPIFYSIDIILNNWFYSAETRGSMLVENDTIQLMLFF